jgi:hypothetical protein
MRCSLELTSQLEAIALKKLEGADWAETGDSSSLNAMSGRAAYIKLHVRFAADFQKSIDYPSWCPVQAWAVQITVLAQFRGPRTGYRLLASDV